MKVKPVVAAPISVPTTSNTLESRVESRKRELIAEIVEYKRNSCRAGSVERIDGLKDRLSALTHIMKTGVVGANGWANIDEGAQQQLADWVAR